MAAHEALAGKQPAVAKEALEKLHSLMVAGEEGRAEFQHQEATVLLNLVRVTLDCAADEGQPPFPQVLSRLRMAVTRAKACGPLQFFPASGGRYAQILAPFGDVTFWLHDNVCDGFLVGL